MATVHQGPSLISFEETAISGSAAELEPESALALDESLDPAAIAAAPATPELRGRQRANHYESAFSSYIRALRVPCVAIDQTRRTGEGQASGLKNPDFLLYPVGGPNLVVEVKGKRGKDARGYRRWENWVTCDDIDGLIRWQTMYGPGFRSVLAFVYEEVPSRDAEFAESALDGTYSYRGRFYRFWAVALDDYLQHLRLRGPAWKAVAMARTEFRRRVRPLIDWLPASRPFDPATPSPRRRVRSRRAGVSLASRIPTIP